MFRSDLSREYSRGANQLARLREELLAGGARLTDLVTGNLNARGLGFPADELAAALEEARVTAAVYRPDPLGRIEAREAIAADFAFGGLAVAPDRILVTPGTSLSYLYAFSILAEPGEEVLTPRPSYPLFDEIARLTGTRLVPYRLRETEGWRVDLEHLETQVSTRTRAIVVISPHNPTGAVVSAAELEGIARIARRHDLAVISDEVFDRFVYDGTAPARAAASSAPLVLTLNGVSKRFALPGWKIGWIAVTGDEDRAARAAWMLAHVSDAFLPVNEWAQCALPGIFRRGGAVTAALRAHLARGRAVALELLARPGLLEITPPAGGFFLTARIAGSEPDEETLARDLLRDAHVVVHPGWFYDLAPDHVVLAFVEEEAELRRSLEALVSRLAGARPPA